MSPDIPCSIISAMVEQDINDCVVNGGCKAECCTDTNFQIEMSKRNVLGFFPGARQVNDSTYKSPQLPQGVYYHRESLRGYLVRIAGPCPHLSGTDCLIHDKKIPQSCKSLHRCSDNCVFFRRRAQQRDLNALSQLQQP